MYITLFFFYLGEKALSGLRPLTLDPTAAAEPAQNGSRSVLPPSLPAGGGRAALNRPF